MVQGDEERSILFIDNEKFEVCCSAYIYLVNNKLSLDQEINIRIGKAATTVNRYSNRKGLGKQKATVKIKILVYQACVFSTLFYGGGHGQAICTRRGDLTA
jgi:hypothetical protein